MLALLRCNDFIANRATYHNANRTQYTSKSNLKHKSNHGNTQKQEDVYETAFNKLVTSITDGIQMGRAYKIVALLKTYKTILNTYGISAAGYKAQKLKNRLNKHFKDKVVFYQPHQLSKSQLMYSSSISIQDLINTASSSNIIPQTNRSYGNPLINVHSKSFSNLYHAAQMIKSDIKNCTDWVLIFTKSAMKTSIWVDESLYKFLHWVQLILHYSL